MKLKDGMMLYHGSYTSVQNIDLTKCAAGKDFGKGFYVTADELQAKNFIRTSLLKAKGLKQNEIIEVIRKDSFMLTVSTKKKEVLNEIYKEIFRDNEIKETIIKYPDMYIVSPVELRDVINYIKSKNLNPREIIINDLNVLSFDLEEIKNKI